MAALEEAVEICRKHETNVYLSGRNYINENIFEENNIRSIANKYGKDAFYLFEIYGELYPLTFNLLKSLWPLERNPDLKVNLVKIIADGEIVSSIPVPISFIEHCL